MLPGRIVNLVATFAAYTKYGVLLLYEKTAILSPLKCCDDLGLFMYVPLISSLFSVDPLVGTKIFFFSVVALFFIVTGGSLFFLSRTMLGYGVVACGLYRLMAPLKQLSDVYIAYMVPFLSIPLLLLALEKKHKNLFLISFFMCGLVGGFSDIIRIYAALPVIVFFLIILVFNSTFVRFKKVIPLAVLLLGYAIPYAHFTYVIHQRDIFLKQHAFGLDEDLENIHVFWHNMYIGFGFLDNKYGIVWEDSCGEAHARKVIPGVEVGTQAYESTIRDLIVNLIKTDRYFVANVLFAKLGVLLFFFLLYFGFLGLLAAYFVPKVWYVEVAFLCCAGISAAPGLLTLPVTAYFMGFITCTVLYTVYSIVHFLNNNGGRQVQKSFRQCIKTIKSSE
jgi:hypothetical protein